MALDRAGHAPGPLRAQPEDLGTLSPGSAWLVWGPEDWEGLRRGVGWVEGAFWNTCRLNNCEVFTLGLVSGCVGRGGGGLRGALPIGRKGVGQMLRPTLPCPPRPTAAHSPLHPNLIPQPLAPPLPRPRLLVPPQPGARARSFPEAGGRGARRPGARPAGSHVFAGGGPTWRGDWRPGRAVRGLPGRWRTRWPPMRRPRGACPGPRDRPRERPARGLGSHVGVALRGGAAEGRRSWCWRPRPRSPGIPPGRGWGGGPPDTADSAP